MTITQTDGVVSDEWLGAGLALMDWDLDDDQESALITGPVLANTLCLHPTSDHSFTLLNDITNKAYTRDQNCRVRALPALQP